MSDRRVIPSRAFPGRVAIPALVGVVAALVLVIFQISVSVPGAATDLGHSIDDVVRLANEPATNALWNFDRATARSLVNGVSTFPGVLRAELIDDRGQKLASAQNPPTGAELGGFSSALFGGDRVISVSIEKETPDGRNRLIGTLVVETDNTALTRTLLHRIAAQCARTLLGIVLLSMAAAFATSLALRARDQTGT